jgi:hypothetical protein
VILVFVAIITLAKTEKIICSREKLFKHNNLRIFYPNGAETENVQKMLSYFIVFKHKFGAKNYKEEKTQKER